jgi:fatty acid desaturase
MAETTVSSTYVSGVPEVAGPRESMARLPGPMQHMLTSFTGRALSGQTAPRWWSPTYHLVSGATVLLLGVAVSALGWWGKGLWLLLLLPGWAATLHGLRNLRMMIFHQCAHKNMYRRSALDNVVGELLASLLVVQNLGRYRQEHVADHHAVHHMTLRDPTVQAFLITMDIQPGMTRRTMWNRVWARLLSPLFHLRFALARLQSFWSGSSRREKIAGGLLYGGAIAGTAATGNLLGLLVVWFVPLFPLFQVSNVLRLCVKHSFPAPDMAVRRGKAYFGALTSGVFIGEATPPAGLRPAAAVRQWARWGLRMAFVHAPVRFLVITGDTPVHDFHHRYPAVVGWADHLYARQADHDRGSPGWPPYAELWGLVPAMNFVFDTISRADPDEFDVSKIRDVSSRPLFTAFDD